MDEQRGDERGQLILIAGIGIAVALVALALVLNSLVFTQYLATKPTADGSDAIAYEHTVEDGVRGLVSEANYREYESSVDTVREGVTGNWSTSLTKQYGAYGTLVNVSVRGVQKGTSIHQDDARRFTNVTGSGNWTPIGNANGVRGFRLRITNASGASADRPLRVNVSITGNGTVEIYDDGTVVVLNATRKGGTDSFSTPATIDFSNGSVNGQESPQLALYDGPKVTSVSITNGDRAVGKYVAVANETWSDVWPDGYYNRRTDRSPYAVNAVYAATLHATYVGPDVTYETGLRVAPDAFGAGPNGLTPEYGVFRIPADVVFRYEDTPTNLSVTNATNVDPRRLAPTDVQVIGPREYDFTGDDVLDVPYVDSSGTLYLANESGSMRLTDGVDHTKSLLAVGYWNDSDAPAVFYTGTGDTVHQVRPGETSTPVFADTSSGVSAVVGTGDVDGDGVDEFVYLGDSQQLRYADTDGSLNKINNGGVGQNKGIGAGAPADLNGDGVDRIPFVDGSGNLLLINDQGSTKVLSGAAAKSPVTTYEVDGDGALEIIYLNQDGRLSYADNATGSATAEPLVNATGQEAFVSKKTGVA